MSTEVVMHNIENLNKCNVVIIYS